MTMKEIEMEPIIIASFCLGMIFGGIATAAVSINEIYSLKKIVSVNNSENITEVIKT